MSKQIPIDDVQDILELIKELDDWVAERQDRMEPLDAVLLLVSQGAYICAKLACEETDIGLIITDAIKIGIDRVKRENDLLDRCEEK